MKIACVVGTRPNFVKMAPIIHAMHLREGALEPFLVHTGQHYDKGLSDVFFEDLNLPEPDVHLGVGSGTHAQQIARVMIAFEEVCKGRKPDLVLVVGDVNSTLAASLVASKLAIQIAHVEAGLRSGDRTMPEEINRIVTDSLADFLFTTEKSGNENLQKEGIPPEKIFFVGNVMIDCLLAHLDEAIGRAPWKRFGLGPECYGVVTLHRPSNVDAEQTLGGIIRALERVAAELPLVFPVHPRTKRLLSGSGFDRQIEETGLRTVKPMGYLDFLGLIAKSRLVLTDSGGLQEETTVLGVPCLTLRHNTERPVTISMGTNRLVGTDPDAIVRAAQEAAEKPIQPSNIPYWDGRAAERIVAVLLER